MLFPDATTNTQRPCSLFLWSQSEDSHSVSSEHLQPHSSPTVCDFHGISEDLAGDELLDLDYQILVLNEAASFKQSALPFLFQHAPHLFYLI